MQSLLTLSPVTRTIAGIIITCCIGIAQGTVHLTGAVPEAWIPTVVAWAGLIAFFGSSIQTGMQAIGITTTNQVAVAANNPKIQQVVTTPDIANSDTFKPVDKVVSKP